MRIQKHLWLILFLVTLIPGHPQASRAADADNQLLSVVKTFESHFPFTPPAGGFYVAVRSFEDKQTNLPDLLSEEIADRFLNLILKRYLGRKPIVIINWKSTTSLRSGTPSGKIPRKDVSDGWQSRLQKLYGDGYLITGTTAVNNGHAIITVELTHIPSMKALATSVETISLTALGISASAKIEKTRLSTTASDKAPLSGRIFIETDPENARIQLVDVPVAYQQGIGLKPGKYRLEISAGGFKPKTQSIIVENGRDVRLKVRLDPAEAFKDLKYQVIEGKNFKYEGYTLDGKKHGMGIYHFSSGAIYDGEWQLDKMHGKGSYTFSGGDRYHGEWENGKMNGKGTYRYKNGDQYVGHWKSGQRHGPGVHHFKAGDKWEGSYADDRKHGRAVYIWTDGKSENEVWENGKRVE